MEASCSLGRSGQCLDSTMWYVAVLQNTCAFRNQGGEENPELAITVRGPGQSMTVATISQMSPADFSSLWTVCIGDYFRAGRQLLLQSELLSSLLLCVA